MHLQILIAIFLLPVFLTAQDPVLNSLLGKEQPFCKDVSINAANKLSGIDLKTKKDSILQILDYWKSICGYGEAVFRVEVLLKAAHHELDNTDLPSFTKEFIKDYQSVKNRYRFYPPLERDLDYIYIPVNHRFNTWTQEVADELLRRSDNTALEKFFLQFYSSQPIEEVQKDWYGNDAYDHLPVAQEYRQDLYAGKNAGPRFLLHAALWQPTGKLAKYIGPSPAVGAGFGGILLPGFWLELSSVVRFPQTKAEFKINALDSIFTTRNKFSGNVQLIGGYIAPGTGKNFQAKLLGGLGLDFFDTGVDDPADPNDPEDSDRNISIISFNPALGLDFAFTIARFDQVGLRFMYNFVFYNYGVKAASDLGGNYMVTSLYYRF